MIRLNVPGFYDSDSGGPRWGDAQVFDDGRYYFVIDGYCGVGTSRLVKYLKKRKIKNPYLLITHAHYDHYYGIREIIRDNYFAPKAIYCYDPDSLTAHNSDIKSNIDALKNIIAEAKAKGYRVRYLKSGEKFYIGEMDIEIYREQPAYSGNSDSYLNDGSLCVWFPKLSYFTSGDGPEEMGTLCEKYGIKPKFIKLAHHGNNLPRVQAKKMWALGTRFCWDNDYNTKITDFLSTGREDAIAVGMKYINCHGDFNVIWWRKQAVIYKGTTIYRYSCSYNGKPTLTKAVDLAIVKAVLRGDYGNGDARITNLIDESYNAGLVQTEINTLIKLIKG